MAVKKKAQEITIEKVKEIAKLANLMLTPEEEIKFAVQLSSILSYIAQIEKLDTTSVPPKAQVTGLENVYRTDEVKSSMPTENVLTGATKSQKGHFRVKAIFQE